VTEITDILRDELERLARDLEPRAVPLIIGGGYGLLLSQEHVQQSGVPTVREIPEARSTNDLDLFLSVEIVTDADKMGALRDVLHASGYTASPGAEHYQFRRDVLHRGAQRNIKVDLLAPPPRDLELLEKVRVDARRLRNRMVRGIHAHTTPEAFSISEEVMALKLGEAPAVHVQIPHPYSFLLLKLFAFRDRRNDPAKELRYYHAFDLYRIVAMMTEEGYGTAEALRDRFAGDEVVVEAQRIVAELFVDLNSKGALAVLDHSRMVGATITDEHLVAFLEDLETFFPRPT
jgi:hypothetical protein